MPCPALCRSGRPRAAPRRACLSQRWRRRRAGARGRAIAGTAIAASRGRGRRTAGSPAPEQRPAARSRGQAPEPGSWARPGRPMPPVSAAAQDQAKGQHRPDVPGSRPSPARPGAAGASGAAAAGIGSARRAAAASGFGRPAASAGADPKPAPARPGGRHAGRRRPWRQGRPRRRRRWSAARRASPPAAAGSAPQAGSRNRPPAGPRQRSRSRIALPGRRRGRRRLSWCGEHGERLWSKPRATRESRRQAGIFGRSKWPGDGRGPGKTCRAGTGAAGSEQAPIVRRIW